VYGRRLTRHVQYGRHQQNTGTGKRIRHLATNTADGNDEITGELKRLPEGISIAREGSISKLKHQHRTSGESTSAPAMVPSLSIGDGNDNGSRQAEAGGINNRTYKYRQMEKTHNHVMRGT